MPDSTQSWSTIFEQALLARAAYANLLGVAFNSNGPLTARLSAVMSVDAAQYVADNFGVIDHQSNSSSGYSGTLFQRRVVASGDDSGGFVLALRGTDWRDDDGFDLWFGDIRQIVFGGDAILQRRDMQQHWDGLFNTMSELLLADINVTGHSLGGHLATWFAIDRPQSLGHAFTFNGAGLAFVNRHIVPISQVSNFISDAYPDLAQDTGAQFGYIDRIFIETGIGGEWGLAPGHHSENLLFGIASRYLLSLIDPQLSDAAAMKIMDAIADVSGNSYEDFAQVVRTALGFTLGQGVTEDNGDATIFGLIRLFESAPGQSGHRDAGLLTSLVGLSPSQLVQLAESDSPAGQAARFALVHSLPFAVHGAGATAYLADDYALSNFSTEYFSYRAGYLSALFERNIADSNRVAGMPYGEMYLDEETDTALASVGNPDPQISRQVIFGRNSNGVTLETLQGGPLNDRIFGAGGNDRLIGGAGSDTLEGGPGDDILEGGPGSDTAIGGVGSDTYRYFEGDGHLTIQGDDGLGSGGSADVISVNLSSGNYNVGVSALSRLSDGSNVYFDQHNNRFSLDATTLTVALEDGGSIVVEDFQSGDFGITLPTTPVAYEPPASPTSFTVAPNDTPNPSASPAIGYFTGISGWYSASAYYATQANEIITASAAVAGSGQTIYAPVYGGFGDSHVFGDVGFNWIHDDASWQTAAPYLGVYGLGADVGTDYVDAGAGDDWVVTRGGDDEVHGGAGNDVIVDSHATWDKAPIAGGGAPVLYDYASTAWVEQAGHSSNDTLFGDGGNDYIAAHGGNQTIDGGADDDELFGGAGGDFLYGGTGDDVLSGDTRLSSTPFVLTGTLPSGAKTFAFNGDLLTGEQTSYGNDVLDGGEGNDTLFGGGGDDILRGGNGNDRIQGDFLGASIYTDLRTGLQSHGADGLSIQGYDTIYGGSGIDTIYGGAGIDVIDGGTEDDTIRAGADDDFVDGGEGNDYLVGDDATGVQGVDDISGGAGKDQIFGMGGDDRLFGNAGNDVIVGGNGNDTVASGNDTMFGGDGDDDLFGQDGDDVLLGGAGQDELQGGAGNDTLLGGGTASGDDVLLGGAGNDHYVLNLGDGAVQITDTEGVNRLSFGSGVASADVRVTRSAGLVFIDFSATDYAYMDDATFRQLSELEIDAQTPLDANAIQHLFEPGTVADGTLDLGAGVVATEISYHGRNDDLVIAYNGAVPNWIDTGTLATRNIDYETGDGTAYGLDAGTRVLVLTNWFRGSPTGYVREIHEPGQSPINFTAAAYAVDREFAGSEGTDLMTGTDGDDVLSSSAGADILEGGDGNDDLTGGAGGDLLVGGAGDDTYRYNTGDGGDLILDEGGVDDVVHFGPGITAEGLTVTETAAGLHVQVGAPENADSITILNWSQGGGQSIDRFTFNNGTSLDRAQIDALNTGNHSPRVSSDLFVRARSNQPFSYTVPAGTITDSDAGDTLTYAAKLDDGRALPAWLTFNPATLTFSGTPTPSEAGDLNVSIQVTDSAGLSNDLALKIDVMGIINGTAGADNLTAPGPAGMEIHGLAGNDIIYGAEGGDELFGEDGDDNLESMGGDDLLNGGAGVDYLAGGDGNDVLDAGPGNDYLRGDYGANVLIGGPGNDYFADGIYEGHVSSNTIRLGLGDGADYTAQDSLDGDDTIEFGSGISAAYVRANMYIDPNGDLFLAYNPGNAGERIRIDVWDWLGGDAVGGSDAVVRFATGESYTIENLFAELHVLTEGDNYYITFDGTPIHTLGGSDLVLYRGSGNFFLSFFGGEGNDHLDAGFGGGDQLDGGPGNDTLLGSPGASTLIGGAGNDYLAGGPGGDDVLNGGDGDDTYSLEQQSLYGGTDTIVEAPGGGVDAVIVDTSYTLGANLESVTYRGGAPVVLTGNDLDNVINGGSNNDTLIGGLGNDSLDGGAGYNTLIGGAGNDVYLGADQGQLITEYAGEGIDTVHSSDTAYQLGSNLENLVLISTQASDGSGNELDNVLIGNSRNNYLSGDDGNDVLDGGAGGTDVLAGGYGDDIYVVARTSGISISENPDEGADLVQASVTYTLGSNLENLTLTGTAAINGTGNSLVNVITGNGGNNALSGGTGADALFGGAGNDTYTVDNVGDAITELAGEGTDLVNASLSYTLAANVENLTLTGTTAINGTGNTLDNVLTGNSGNNTLTGSAGNDTLSGGTGSDTMVGGQGNDTFVVAQTGDVVTELAGEGIDLVQSSITHTLANNVENLTLTGTTAINGTGNALDNVLTGNSKNNTLTGNAGNDLLDGGTAGTDALRGGTGNDTYIVARTTGITITENANEGTDRVQSSVTYTLGNNLENLTLTGTSAINGTGNTLNNTLVGNGAVNTLSGGTGADVLIGNAGNDTLTGGNGADIYQYASGDGADVVNDAGTDGASDLLGFTNLAFSQVTLARSTNDLLISRNGSATDSVRVTNWFTVTGNQIETVQFTDQALTNTQINSLIGGGSFAARIDPELERGFLSFLGAINGFTSREDMVADWGSRPSEEATMELAVNSVDAAIVRGGVGRGKSGHTMYQQL